MPHVVFVAPRFLDNTNRYVRAFAALDDVTLSVISADPESAIPAEIRPRVAAHYAVTDVLDGAQLTAAAGALSRHVGRIDRLTGALEQLQMPMAQAREALGIEGINTAVARNFRDKDRMKEVLRAHGVPVARSALVRSGRAPPSGWSRRKTSRPSPRRAPCPRQRSPSRWRSSCARGSTPARP